MGITCLGLSALFFSSPSCLGSKALCQGQSVLLHTKIFHIGHWGLGGSSPSSRRAPLDPDMTGDL